MSGGRERLTTILLLAGMTAVFVAAVNLPGRRAAAAMKDEIARSRAEIARGAQAVARHRSEQSELDGRVRYLAETAQVFAPADPHDLLGRISRLAREIGLKVKRLEPEPVRPQASYGEHPFRLEFGGDFASLLGFLNGLERDSRLFTVEDLAVHQAGDWASGGDLEGVMRFAVFVERADSVKLPEESGSPAGP